MNWVDVILALLFTAGLAGGYIQRLLRQALSLGALVCGIILATYLQVPLAAGIAYVRPEIRARTRETAAFWLLLVAITVALDVIQRRVLPETALLAVGILDRIGGVFVAFFTVCGQMSVAVLVLRFFGNSYLEPYILGERAPVVNVCSWTPVGYQGIAIHDTVPNG